MELDSDVRLGDRITAEFFSGCVDSVAARLVGCFLFSTAEDVRVGGQIIEVESYCENDPAAHCYPDNPDKRRLRGSDPMRNPGGCVYLYSARHGQCCLNLTCGAAGFGSAVLIRALRPVCGLEIMRKRRINDSPLPSLRDDAKFRYHLCNGPGNLWDALGWLDLQKYNGSQFEGASLELYSLPSDSQVVVSCGSRVGIDEQNPAAKWLRSYVLADEEAVRYLSQDAKRKVRYPFPPPPPELCEVKTAGLLKACDCM